MKRITVENFDIDQIAKSGQCFRMTKREDEKYSVIAGDKYLCAWQEGNMLYLDCSDEEYSEFWEHYFDIETDYAKYMDVVDPKDDYLNKALKLGSGIRILNQELWEMIVSFLISQQNNITRIRRCIQNISEKYGKKMTAADGSVYYSFPKPVDLAYLPEDALMECNLGYRSKYVVRTAKAVAEGEFVPEKLFDMDYDEAKKELLKLYGVGNKVADCICLFALHKIDAFPVDTHIRQVLEAHYSNGFPFDRYEGFAGVIQQYIFYYEVFGGKTNA